MLDSIALTVEVKAEESLTKVSTILHKQAYRLTILSYCRRIIKHNGTLIDSESHHVTALVHERPVGSGYRATSCPILRDWVRIGDRIGAPGISCTAHRTIRARIVRRGNGEGERPCTACTGAIDHF